jgi:hypothetical protein
MIKVKIPVALNWYIILLLLNNLLFTIKVNLNKKTMRGRDRTHKVIFYKMGSSVDFCGCKTWLIRKR